GGALPDLAAALSGARPWLQAPVPPAVTDALLPALQAEAAYLRSLGHDTLYAAAPQGRPGQYWSMFARFGLPHIFPPRSYFAPTQGLRLLACRAAHAARAGARLARGSLDGLARDLIVRCRQHPRQPAPPHNSGLPKHTSPHKMSAIENPYKPQGDPMLDNHTQFAKVGDVVRRQIADETILVPVRQTAEALDSIYSVNPVAARIWDLLDGHKSMGEIRAALLEEYDVAPAELDADIESFVAQLKGEQLIQEA
ncbi:MAG: PqqD family protein, partial [Candidatus Marinimicrobia bacterium]|nr:PqqD family protein [Candidatus Neomarinimicrobiota bacterium]